MVSGAPFAAWTACLRAEDGSREGHVRRIGLLGRCPHLVRCLSGAPGLGSPAGHGFQLGSGAMWSLHLGSVTSSGWQSHGCGSVTIHCRRSGLWARLCSSSQVGGVPDRVPRLAAAAGGTRHSCWVGLQTTLGSQLGSLSALAGQVRPEATLNSWAGLLAWFPAAVGHGMSFKAAGPLWPCFPDGQDWRLC